MSMPNNRRQNPGSALSGPQILGMSALGVGIFGTLIVYLAVRGGHAIAGTEETVPTNPLAIVFGLATGKVTWPGVAGWVILAGGIVILGAIAAFLIAVVQRTRKRRTRVDRAAAYMGRGRDIEDQGEKKTRATAQRLGVTSAIGLPIGVTVAGGQQLYSSWEDQRCTIAGPRVGKTTSMVVPEILDAPGPVLGTSNKRDLHDATRGPRAAVGTVWVFDPQSVAGGEPTWWWNPLSYVTDETKAEELAKHFGSGSQEPGVRRDAHFDPMGEALLACYFLAAALGGKPLTQVWTWLTRPGDTEAVDILTMAGVQLTAAELTGMMNTPDEERGSIYSTARRMARCLTNRKVAPWVTPLTEHDPRPQFDPAAFVASTDTLYSLSREGSGSAGPLITALTVAVTEAAEQLAARSPQGRLARPLTCVLDEAANVCRWRDLPALYSHYGSRGIVIDTILQSWSQGCEVWGESGMKKLWSAANVRVYAGGATTHDGSFLEDVARMIGQYDRLSQSLSTGQGSRSVSSQLHRERILDVDDLAALPKGRAIVMASGSRPTLIRTVPWMAGPHKDAVLESIRTYDPQATGTIDEAFDELAAVSQAEAERSAA